MTDYPHSYRAAVAAATGQPAPIPTEEEARQLEMARLEAELDALERDCAQLTEEARRGAALDIAAGKGALGDVRALGECRDAGGQWRS